MILLSSIDDWLLLICWLDWLLLIHLLLDGLLLVNSRLLLVNLLLSIVPVVLLKLHWLWLLGDGASAHSTGRHAMSSSCAMSVKVDACDGKCGYEEQAVKSQSKS